MLKLSIEISSNQLVEACMQCIKPIRKACVKQCLNVLAHVFDEPHIYKLACIIVMH